MIVLVIYGRIIELNYSWFYRPLLIAQFIMLWFIQWFGHFMYKEPEMIDKFL